MSSGEASGLDRLVSGLAGLSGKEKAAGKGMISAVGL
jgi:hypothetical protein